MSSLVISGDTSGTVTVTVPAVAGTNTATLPAATGTVMVSGNMPAFSVQGSLATQSISASTASKIIIWGTPEWDTTNAWNSANSYYQPLVAGYYQVSATVAIGRASTAVSGGNYGIQIYKNITQYRNGMTFNNGGTNDVYMTVSSLVYLNGSTDYVAIYVFNGTGSTTNVNSQSTQYFTACLVRAA